MISAEKKRKTSVSSCSESIFLDVENDSEAGSVEISCLQLKSNEYNLELLNSHNKADKCGMIDSSPTHHGNGINACQSSSIECTRQNKCSHVRSVERLSTKVSEKNSTGLSTLQGKLSLLTDHSQPELTQEANSVCTFSPSLNFNSNESLENQLSAIVFEPLRCDNSFDVNQQEDLMKLLMYLEVLLKDYHYKQVYPKSTSDFEHSVELNPQGLNNLYSLSLNILAILNCVIKQSTLDLPSVSIAQNLTLSDAGITSANHNTIFRSSNLSIHSSNDSSIRKANVEKFVSKIKNLFSFYQALFRKKNSIPEHDSHGLLLHNGTKHTTWFPSITTQSNNSSSERKSWKFFQNSRGIVGPGELIKCVTSPNDHNSSIFTDRDLRKVATMDTDVKFDSEKVCECIRSNDSLSSDPYSQRKNSDKKISLYHLKDFHYQNSKQFFTNLVDFKNSTLFSTFLFKKDYKLTSNSVTPIPNSVRVKVSRDKENQCLSHLWLIKELRLPGLIPVWSLSVSCDGLWLASGGQDGLLRLWRIESNDSVPIFSNDPTVTLHGHASAVIVSQWDLTLLPNNVNRIASASLDRTVRIWLVHPNSKGDLHQSIILHCADWATAVCFHTVSKNLLYTGALDGTIQVWRIPIDPYNLPDDTNFNKLRSFDSSYEASSKRLEMIEFIRMTDLLTAMSISPEYYPIDHPIHIFFCSGHLLAVGLCQGRVSIYESRTLRFYLEVDCRNRKGRNSAGRKVTGIVWSSDNNSICVSTGDSRIRLISLSNLSNWDKFKGSRTSQMMLHAQFSPSEHHLICGSESRCVHVWNIYPDSPKNPLISARFFLKNGKRPTNNQYEKFKVFNELLTTCIAPNELFGAHIINAIMNMDTQNNDVLKNWHTLKSQLDTYIQSNLEYKVCKGNSLYGLIIIAGGYQGTIRIFINSGDPVSTY